MRRCERHSLSDVSFEGDANVVRSMIPLFPCFSETLHQIELPQTIRKLYLKLCVRMHWLVATFYVWWSKNTSQPNKIEEAEVLALQHLQKAIEFLDQPESDPIKVIRTPHLESPGRIGCHWKELVLFPWPLASYSSYTSYVYHYAIPAHAPQL